jgi:hypothetical protein
MPSKMLRRKDIRFILYRQQIGYVIDSIIILSFPYLAIQFISFHTRYLYKTLYLLKVYHQAPYVLNIGNIKTAECYKES